MRVFLVALFFFAALSAPLNLWADDLTLYFYPSPGLSWKSPRSLALGVLKSKLLGSERQIGHVTVEVSCEGNKPFHFFTGASQIDRDSPRLLFREGYGLGILFHDFPGYGEDSAELLPELEKRYQSGNLSFIHFKINAPTCRRLETYLKEYKDRGYDKHYGLSNRPLFCEGAGCSAFGASFLEVAGLLDPIFTKHWSMKVRVPRELIGGPLTHQYVPFTRILWADRWAEENEPHQSLFFWSPDQMHEWVRKTWAQASQVGAHYKPEMRGKAVGLEIDRRNTPTPSGPIWHHDP